MKLVFDLTDGSHIIYRNDLSFEHLNASYIEYPDQVINPYVIVYSQYSEKFQLIIEHLMQGGLYVQFMVSKFKYLNMVSHFIFQD